VLFFEKVVIGARFARATSLLPAKFQNKMPKDSSKKASSSEEPSTKKKKVSKRDSTFNAIAKQFNKAQKAAASHDKCIATLLTIHKKDYSKFLQHFFELIHPVLIAQKNEKHVNHTIQFIVKYCLAAKKEEFHLSEEEEEDGVPDFSQDIIHNLIVYSNAKDKTIRYRVAQIVGLIQEKTNDVDLEFHDTLRKKFLPRLRDKIPNVRHMAVVVLEKLQEPTADCPVIQEFCRLMSTDSSKEVRKEAVKRVILTRSSLPYILEKIKDVKEEVRIAGYEKIFSEISIKQFSIKQRVNIIKTGLQERSTSVREQVEDLIIKKWFGQNSTIQEFLEYLDVVEYEETCEKVIKLIMDHALKSENVQIKGGEVDFEKLSDEMALFWRCKAEHLHQRKQPLEELLPPSITEFVHLVIHYIKEGNDFVVSQLLMIAKFLDYSDEVGRRNVHSLLAEMLVVFQSPEYHVKEIVQTLKSILPNHEDFQSTILNKIDILRKAALDTSNNRTETDKNSKENDTKQAIKTLDDEKNKILAEIKKLNVEKNRLAAMESYLEAKKKKDEIFELQKKTDQIDDEIARLSLSENEREDSEEVSMWLRALHITSQFISQSALPIDISQFIYLFDDLILETIDSDFAYLRMMSTTLLGQFCSLNLDLAKEHVRILVDNLSKEKDDACINAILEALFDIFFIHSVPNVFSNKEESTKVISKIKSCFITTSRQVRTTSVEGFAKLLFAKKMDEEDTANILSDLILLLFNEATEHDNRLRQCLSIFLPFYSHNSVNNIKKVASVFLYTLRRVIHAEIRSTTSKINIQTLIQYLIELTNPEKLVESQKLITKVDSLQIHENIALSLAYEILLQPGSKEAVIYCRQFTNLSIYSTNKRHIRKLKILIDRATGEIDNKLCVKTLEKFSSILDEHLERSKKDDEEAAQTDDDENELLQEIEQEFSNFEIDEELFIDEHDEKNIEKSTTPEGIKKLAKKPNNPSVPKVDLIEIGEERTNLKFTTPKKRTSRTIEPTPQPPSTLQLSLSQIDASPIPHRNAPLTPSTPVEEIDIRTPKQPPVINKPPSAHKSLPTSASKTQKTKTKGDMYDSEDTDNELLELSSDSEEEEPTPKKRPSTKAKPTPARKSTVQELTKEISQLLNQADLSSDDSDDEF